jgi:TPR repeat protein
LGISSWDYVIVATFPLSPEGNGVEKDEKKELHHLEEAAIAGHPVARHNLGCYEGMNGRMERAVKLSSLLLISDMMIQ